MLYSSVPDVSVCPTRNTFLPFVLVMHALFASSRSRSLDSMPELSKAKYTVLSEQVVLPTGWFAFRHSPSLQSSSSAQSASLLHFFGRLHEPATQVPPGPHSPSDAHGLHAPAWQTCPDGH